MEKSVIQELEEVLTGQLTCSGSSVKIMEMDDKKVILKLLGTCKGCPGAQITVKDTIETVINEQLPEIEEVILDTSCDEELLTFARQLLSRGK